MAVLIATTILIGSILGMIIILFRKIPVLLELPQYPPLPSIGWPKRILNKFKKLWLAKFSSFKKILEKTLLKVKILNLKIENKTTSLLQKLREKSKKEKEEDNFWDEIKKALE
jgi:hypothetical protein